MNEGCKSYCKTLKNSRLTGQRCISCCLKLYRRKTKDCFTPMLQSLLTEPIFTSTRSLGLVAFLKFTNLSQDKALWQLTLCNSIKTYPGSLNCTLRISGILFLCTLSVEWQLISLPKISYWRTQAQEMSSQTWSPTLQGKQDLKLLLVLENVKCTNYVTLIS